MKIKLKNIELKSLKIFKPLLYLTASKHCHICWTLSPHNFKLLPIFHITMEFGFFDFFFFRLIPIPTYLFFQFLEIFINYMSISITIVSNITVLVSHNTIFYGFFMSLNHGVNKKTPSRVSPTSISLPGFQQVCLLLYKK